MEPEIEDRGRADVVYVVHFYDIKREWKILKGSDGLILEEQNIFEVRVVGLLFEFWCSSLHAKMFWNT